AIRQVPGVWDCAVVGLPDERFGERPAAFIVAARDCDLDGPALTAAVQRHCEEYLGRFKRPTTVQLLAALPRTPVGKLLRRRLREIATASQEQSQ
ncbi:MAG TPA: long-chain fatty acid--CoA ligase, partial [Ramlibacter sp.]